LRTMRPLEDRRDKLEDSVMNRVRSNRPPISSEVRSSVWSSTSGACKVSVAWTSSPAVGQTVSGDSVVVRPLGERMLIAIVDALGHGPRAPSVADQAAHYLCQIAESGAVSDLVQGLHEALAGTRGAASLLLVISDDGLEACSVGNVDLRSTTTTLPFTLTP